jgi:hypothetical protein
MGDTGLSGWIVFKWETQAQAGGLYSNGRHRLKWVDCIQMGDTGLSGWIVFKWEAQA